MDQKEYQLLKKLIRDLDEAIGNRNHYEIRKNTKNLKEFAISNDLDYLRDSVIRMWREIEDDDYDMWYLKKLFTKVDEKADIVLREQKPGQRESGETVKEQVSSRKILTAEDNEFNREFLKVILNKSGDEYNIVDNGKEALDKLEEKEYDVLFLDSNMPVMDGVEALKAIKNSDKFGSLKIIAMLPAGEAGKENEYLELGFDDYIFKPINTDEFIKKAKEPK